MTVSSDLRLVSPTGKPIPIPPSRPNAGVQAAYRKRLDALIREMQDSIVYWLRAAYRANDPEIAMDDSPASSLKKAMRRLSRRWQRRFDEIADPLAKRFVESAMRAADVSLAQRLRDRGFSVQFKLTAAANDVAQASVFENVGLIKSIASEHLQEVEGLVMRSVQQGRRLDELTKQLADRYGITKRRAAFIARDQNNKATATITRVRQESLGLTKARWRHSHAGKKPRPSHVAADGKEYDVRTGMLIDGKYIRPGEEPNCRCASESIIPGFES